MSISINFQTNPNIQELKTFIDDAFKEIDSEDSKKFQEANNSQSVDQWLSVEEMLNYLDKGKLLDAKFFCKELVK